MINKLNQFLNSIPMLWVSGLCLLMSLLGEYVIPLLSGGSPIQWMTYFAWASVLISGFPLVYLALWRVVTQKSISSALLISIAMAATIYIGDIFAAGEIAFIMAIGEFLEDRTVEKAKQGIETLLNIVPTQGRVITQGKEVMIEANDITVGQTIRVFPGESFPADGVILEGSTTVDQSIITGESLPVDKTIHDQVFTGTINRFGSVDVQVTKSFANSSLQKMIQLVEKVESNKAPTQKIVDKWASWLVPLACVIAIVSYLIIAFALHQPEDARTRAVTVLVVFCPCALALATPTSIIAAIGQATKQGVLIKSGEALERMGRVSTVAFDKTGTLTHGKLMVSDLIPYCGSKEQLLSLTAAAEGRSEHPIGKAVVAHAKREQCTLEEIQNFVMTVGKGVSAQVQGETLFCGNERLIQEQANLTIPQNVAQDIAQLRAVGKAIIIVATQGGILGLVGLSDQVKATAKGAISALEEAGIQTTVLLTGDNEKSANFVASQIGITQIQPSLLPEDKVQAIEAMMNQGQQVCMIGDGVNDAPALKTATVGIAMGTMGSDIAIDAADIAIMGDDISKISYIKKLSDATIFSIKFNITLSMCINLVAIVLSVTGLLTPTTGALVHNAGSVLVVLNAARLYDKTII